MEQKSIQHRGANSRAKKSTLGVVLVRFWVDFQGVLGSKMLIFHWFLKLFVKINVFDEDWYPRAIRTSKWNQNETKIDSETDVNKNEFIDIKNDKKVINSDTCWHQKC